MLLAQPPKARVDNVTDNYHGVTVTDPYRWLEDKNSPETRTWVEAQMKYTRSVLDKLPEHSTIRDRLRQLLYVETMTAPRQRAGRYFFTRRKPGQSQSVIYYRQGLKGEDVELVDPNPLNAEHTSSAAMLDVSEDGKLLVYGIRQGGEDEVAVSIMDVDTKQLLPDKLERARLFGVSMKPDKSGFYYSKFGAEGSRVYYHAMGSEAKTDKLIFGEGYGPAEIIVASLSRDGRYLGLIVLHGSAGKKTEIWYQDLAGGGPVKPLVNDVDARFEPELAGGTMFISTNWKAPNGRVLAVDLKNPARDQWREVVPESKSAIEGISAAGGRIAVTYLENAITRVKIFDPSGKQVREIATPGIGSTSGLMGEWEEDEAFYRFVSFTSPPAFYRYQVSTGKQELWARVNMPIDPGKFKVEQVWYESKDKTRIPMFLVSLKGAKRDGTMPVLLTGYGGFNVSMTPYFSAMAAVWVEMGGVYALANLRGGGEFGEKWHEAGMFDKKQNVFDDFISAGDWLVAKGYTKPARLAIEGGSNGGLLVGAAITQRPDLFGAAICAVPLLDMLRFQKFLVARFWVSEYGSADDPKQFPYIYKYSPYQHVKPGAKYPAVMFVTGDSDTRVDPLHARKMAARMQAAQGGTKPILLHYDTKAGHSGGQPVDKQIADTTDELVFLRWQLGVK